MAQLPDVCCDIHCDCGEFTHYDGDFFYFFKCPRCGQHWEVGTHMPIYKVTAERAGSYVKLPPLDEEANDLPLPVSDPACPTTKEP